MFFGPVPTENVENEYILTFSKVMKLNTIWFRVGVPVNKCLKKWFDRTHVIEKGMEIFTCEQLCPTNEDLYSSVSIHHKGAL